MGYSATAFSAIGTFIPRENLVTETEEASCRHDDIARKGKFCSECGKRVTMDTIEHTELFDNMDDIVGNFGLNGFQIYDKDQDTIGWVIGFVLHANSGDPEDSPMPDITEIQENINRFLTEHSIDVPSKIKLISYLYESY